MIEFRYSLQLYPTDILTTALNDYREFGEMCVSEMSTTYWVIKFRSCKYGDKETSLEFNNFLIELLNANGLYVD
jgi:hypothetical protein